MFRSTACSFVLLSAAFSSTALGQPAKPAPARRTLEVPSRFATIRQAIDSAKDGDTVLVARGHYAENVRFNGKNIVLTSLFARTRDPRDIIETVLDGSRPTSPDSGSTVMIVDREDSTAVLQGFTIVGGTGTVWYDLAGHTEFREGGGVLCELSAPTIRYNRIMGNLAVQPRDSARRIRSGGGGGIRCGYAEPRIEYNVIVGNRGRYGGGMTLYHSAATVRYNVIAGNLGGEDFGGAGTWAVRNLSYRLTSVFDHNTIVANVQLRPPPPNRNEAGAALFNGVTTVIADNFLAANRLVDPSLKSGSQFLIGPEAPVKLSGNVDDSSAVRPDDWRTAVRTSLRHKSAGAFADGTASSRILQALVDAPEPPGLAIFSVDLRARRTELLRADSALGRGGAGPAVNALSEGFTEDATIFGPGTTTFRGGAELRAFLARDTSISTAQARWSPIRADVSADGNDGFTFGNLDITGGSTQRRSWKYLAYWRRDASGAWRMLAHKRLPRGAGAVDQRPPAGFAIPVTTASSWYPSGPAALARLFAVDSAFGRAGAKDVVAAFKRYTAADGATLSGDSRFAWGPDSVAAQFAQFGPGLIEWAPERGEIAASGDLAWATGIVIIRERKDGVLVEAVRGRYFTIWQRKFDGLWRLIIDG